MGRRDSPKLRSPVKENLSPTSLVTSDVWPLISKEVLYFLIWLNKDKLLMRSDKLWSSSVLRLRALCQGTHKLPAMLVVSVLLFVEPAPSLSHYSSQFPCSSSSCKEHMLYLHHTTNPLSLGSACRART